MTVRWTTEHGGAVGRLVLDHPHGNVMDTAMLEELRAQVAAAGRDPRLTLIVLEGAGPHFSFGASVEDHLPGRFETFIPAFHALFRELEATGIPTAAVVRGRCLGGGAELAIWCGMVIAEPHATIGFPEVRLGVFPPVAAAALRWRTSGATAARLVTSGQVVTADDALRLGLVDLVAPHPEEALQGWYQHNLAGTSTFAARQAWQAARRPLAAMLADDLPAAEARYLGPVMAHPDALEGLTAFVEKRAPTWRHA